MMARSFVMLLAMSCVAVNGYILGAPMNGLTSFAPSLRVPWTRKSGLVGTVCSAASTIVYGELQHCGVLVDDVEVALRFYVDVLGMEDVSHLRPTKLEYPGAFLKCGINQIHLMKLPSIDPREGRPEHGGRDRHLAVTVANIDPLSENLTAKGIKFTMSKSGRRALFCRDPYMNAIEFVEDTSISAA